MQEGESKCNDGSKQSPLVKPGSSVELQANLTDQQIQTALAVSSDAAAVLACSCFIVRANSR